MGRWAPGTRERLQEAALELFATRGFEQTTAAEIAEAVGLTERTFFRHFADKREVLFAGQEQFVAAFEKGIAGAPTGAAPFAIVAAALDAAATSFFPDELRPHSRRRQLVIEQNPALLERERHKLAGLAGTLGVALRARGVVEPAATLAAESATSVFGIAFAMWLREGEQRSLAVLCAAVLAELTGLAGE
jgi:AcrR family transcriptional regulator